MMFPQQNPNLEDAKVRIARFERAIVIWRREGYSFVTLSARGTATPHRANVLPQLVALVERNPGAQLVALDDPRARNRIIQWALQPRPVDTKGSN